MVGLVGDPTGASAATTATLSVDAANVIGTVNTTLTTQIVWPTIPGTPNAQTRLNTLAPKMVRIHAGTDGGFDNVVLPFNVAGKVLEGGGTKQPWDFAMMDSMVNSVKTAGTVPVMNVRYAPDPMYTCTGNFGDPGTLRDQTYGVFSDYMANLVRYYNLGSFTMPQGGTKTNPAGTTNKITWWEIWNEPDYPWENPCTGDGTNPIVNPSQYVALWNATAAKMKAVDPTIKLVGPAPSNHPSLVSGTLHDPNDYVPLLLRNSTIKPDAISFHGYGGWDNTQGDRLLFDGNGGGGIKADIDGLADIKSWIAQYAPGTAVWLTETNVSADPGLDSAQRAWNQFSAAWGASLFRAMVVGGLSVIHQFQFLESKQLGLIDDTTGSPLLPYWRDYYLSRYFPVGSPILLSTPSAGAPEVEMLAARQPGGNNVRVLVIDRQVGTTKAIGLPVTVTLNLQNFAGLQSVNMRMLDTGTLATLATGPALIAMPASTTQTIAFGGYGAALLEFSTNVGPSPTPTPTATATPTPTPTPGPSPSPTVTSVTPSSGSTLGGTFVTVRGTNFRPGAIVSFGGSPLSGLVIAGTTITGTTPVHGTGAVNVIVTNTDATTASCASCYTYSTATPSPSPSGSGSPTPTPTGSGSPTPTPTASPTPTPPLGAPTETVYLPNVTKLLGGADGWDTPFIVQNTGTVPTTLRLSFYRFSDGALIAQRVIGNLMPGRSYADVPSQDAALVSDTQYSVVVESFGAPIVSVVNETEGSGDQFQALSYTGATGGATTVYLPNITRRFYGYDTPFIVQNVGNAQVLATVNFTSFDGGARFTKILSISPGRSVAVDPDFTTGLVDGTQYSVVLTADGPVAVVVNAHQKNDPRVSYSTNGIGAGSSTLYGPYVVKSGPAGANSPIVVQNTGSSNVDATLELTPMSGGAAQRFVLSGIPAGQSRVFDPRFTLGTVEPCTSASDACLGVGEYAVKITANGSIAALVIPTGPTTADAYATSGFGGNRLYLPNVTRALGGANGWTTPIVLQSTGALGATLRWYRFSDGSLDATQHVSLPPGGALWIDPRTVAGLQNEGQYAVVVDGDGGAAVNAIVYEQWLGGGDGVMIYSGFAR